MRFRHILPVLAALTCAPLTGSTAETDGRTEARELASAGLTSLDEGRYGDAINKLRQAESKFHAPTHLLYIAQAQQKLGQHKAAYDTYLEILSEPIPNYASPAFHDAKRSAAAAAQDLHAKLALMTITLVGAPASGATVTIDGRPLKPAQLAHPVALTPGEHAIAASAEGLLAPSQSIDGAVGKLIEVRLQLAPTESAAPARDAPQHALSDDGGVPVGPVIALAVGGAALLGGAITGFMTLDRAGDIKEACNGQVCPPEQQPEADDTKTLGNVSTALFIVGGVVASAGIVWWLVDDAPAQGSQTSHTHSTTVALKLGLAGASLQGSF